MACFRSIFVLTTLFFFIAGCGSVTTIKKDDQIVVLEEFRERAETQWDENYTDGFMQIIPKGTVLKVLYTPAPAGQVIECRPIEVNGIKDPDKVETFFVPEHIKNKEGYQGYAFAIQKSFLGKQVKKVE